MEEPFPPLKRPPCSKHGKQDCEPCYAEAIDRLVANAKETRITMREVELQPMLDAGFTRSQAEYIADNLLSNPQ